MSSNFYEFLSVLFDIAADTSYFNSQGRFGTKLSNTTITEEINPDLMSATSICADISSLAHQAGFVFDGSMTVG